MDKQGKVPRKILLIQMGRLGDLVQTLPLIRRIKEEFPQAELTLVCQTGFHRVMAETGGWDRLIDIRQGDVDALTDPLQQQGFPDLPPFDGHPAFREQYHSVVCLTSDAGSAILCDRIAGVEKLGRIHTLPGEIRLKGTWAKYLFGMISHRRDNLFNLVDLQMGMAGLAPKPQPPCLPVPDARAAEARALLKASGWKGQRPLIAFQTGASDLNRAWDLANFSALGMALASQGMAIALVGDASETDRAQRFQAGTGGLAIDLVGKTDIGLLPGLIRACDFLVSNDTGTIHIAAAVGTPTLGLFFSTAYFTETAPYGHGHSVLQVELACSPCNATDRCPVQTCRDYLPVEAVAEAVGWALRPASQSPRPRPNLSLYRSAFLSNGSLAYLPVLPGRPSEHYLSALMGRLLWERALDLEPGQELESLRNAVRDLPSWQSHRAGLEEMLNSLSGMVSRGADLSSRLAAEFKSPEYLAESPAQPSPPRERIRILHHQLAGLGTNLVDLARRGGLFGQFLHYEWMDMDYLPYPALAHACETKYRSLEERIARMQGALATL